MEELKKLDEITQPDERQKAFAVVNRISGQRRPLTLRDIYESASSIKLHDGVPEVIRNHFATAQNLLVYSWFFYPFNVAAHFLALVTVESALKVCLNPKKRTSFKGLVKLAVGRGLVRDEGFSHIRQQSEFDGPREQDTRILPQQVKSYVETLADIMPYLRNELAHGSHMLHPNGASLVRICAEFINQLFPEKSS